MKSATNGILLIICLLFGCHSNRPDHSDKTVFRYNEASGISSLDPAFARGQADIWACNQLFNGLVQMNDQLEVIPCIARSWSISDDGLEYRFLLRDDVFFHDHPLFRNGKGRKITAYDFEYSFNRLVSPELASPGIWVFNTVDVNDKNEYAFKAYNDSLFVIRLQNPFPPFLGILTSLYCSVVPKEIIDEYGKDFRKNPVGTGPFKFFMWEQRAALIFHKNDNYFEFENGNRLPYLDAVSITFLSDRQAAFLEFVKGNLDFISGIDAGYKDELLERSGALRDKYNGKFRMETCSYLNTEYLGFMVNSDKTDAGNPILKKEIRQAINYGFDRVKMITYLRNGIGTPGKYGMIPPGLPSFDSTSVSGYNYNTLKVDSLLNVAGFPGGQGLPEIVLSTTKEYQDLCEFMQGQLAESGIRIKLEVNQGAAHREMVAKQKLSFFRASWIADYPDAENYLSLFYSENYAPAGPNYTHFKSEKFDSLYLKASATVNDSIRYRLYTEMDQLVIDDAPVVVLYYDQVVRLYQNQISGLGNNAMNLLNLKKVRKNKTSD